MGPIGFSTGALAYSDFRRGLSILRGRSPRAVELSALRENELAPLVEAFDSLDLSHFTYISVHAPSRFEPAHERNVIELLRNAANRLWPIVLHPDAAHDFAAWSTFQELLLIENMDKRNQTGKTADELAAIFERLPAAGLCLDLGHCRQVDPTMNEACLILRKFGSRLKQLHISEVNSRSTHDPLSEASIRAFQEVSHFIPDNVPVILESPVTGTDVELEMEQARLALSHSAPTNRSRRSETRSFHAAAL